MTSIPKFQDVDRPLESSQVAWYETHLFITELVAAANVGPLPAAGTPSWAALPDTDPAKLLSLALAGSHHVLRVETGQSAAADASHAISAAADWAQVAREIQQLRGSGRIPRRREAA